MSKQPSSKKQQLEIHGLKQKLLIKNKSLTLHIDELDELRITNKKLRHQLDITNTAIHIASKVLKDSINLDDLSNRKYFISRKDYFKTRKILVSLIDARRLQILDLKFGFNKK